jgi:hypothetical protein
MTARREFPRPVKFEIIKRATRLYMICCEGCGLVLGAKRWQIDHTIPDALAIDKSRPLTAADGKLLGLECCHKPKTARDVGVIAKARRQEARNLGLRKRSSFPCGKDSPFKKKISGEVVER